MRSIILSLILAASVVLPSAQNSSSRQPHAYSISRFTGLTAQTVEALLYNPVQDTVSWRYPADANLRTRGVEPRFAICGKGFPEGQFQLSYSIEGAQEVFHAGQTEVTVEYGGFEKDIAIPTKYPQATRVSWQLTASGQTAMKGVAPLRWSRFRGKLEYLDGEWRPSFLDLYPNGFRSPLKEYHIPVGSDGTFDVLVPAHVYAVINVNGVGYLRNSMERWAWDYDLLGDRSDVFTLGRTELYAIHAFDIEGPISTVFIAFRPTALSRVLVFDRDGDGRLSSDERKTMELTMKDSPTVIGPELEAKDVKVWLNGKEERIVQFNKIPEYDGGLWQVQYLLQIYPDPRPPRGVWHEIKLEVRSREKHKGREIVDFGQGSVGFFRH